MINKSINQIFEESINVKRLCIKQGLDKILLIGDEVCEIHKK